MPIFIEKGGLMITVVSVGELKKLLMERELKTSENVEFILPESLNFLSDVFKETNEVEAGKVIWLNAAEGKQVTEVDISEIEDPNGGFMAYLPLLDEPQVCLIIKKEELPAILFSSDLLDEIEGADLDSEEVHNIFKDLITEGPSVDDDCVYALTKTLKPDMISEILYPPELEETISKIKENSGARDILYKKTTLFNQED